MSKSKPGRVIVVGSSNTDLVVHCDTLPSPGETVLGEDMLTFAGGKGANQAVAAARAGAKVHFIGAFGDDAFGKARRADLEREGIDCSGCVVKKGVPSGVALIGIGRGAGAKAENLIIVAPGANARLMPADVKRGMPKGLNRNDVVLCSLEIPMESVVAALRIGGAWKGATRILNPAPFPKSGLPPVVFDFCRFITPNETEFQSMAGDDVMEFNEKKFKAAFSTTNHNFLNVIVTRGPQGVVSTNGEEPIRPCPAPKVRAIDTVGAGDCFNGCLAAELANGGHNWKEFAVAAASLKVTRQGAQAGMPYRHEILKMMKQMK